jgi:hypothetical protein
MKNDFINSAIKASKSLLMLALAFVIFEPAISAAVEDTFTITQSVTSEISFLTPATDVTMGPSIAGITGGTSNGGTQVVVLTNNAAGYTMTLTASSSAGMVGNSQGGTIPAYIPSATGVPDFTFTTPANRARFGYTVEASTTADLDQSFKDDGASTCNTGSSDTALACWLNASTTAETIVNRTSETAASGATTTLRFRVVINSSPSPAIPQDTYVATTTLTATTN